MFAIHIINNIYIFYLRIINDNALSSVAPVLGRYNLLEINLANLESVVQDLKLIVPAKLLLMSYYKGWVKRTERT
jgi:hypothetical protein